MALLRNLSVSLIGNESVRTTLAKAKETEKFVSKLITKAKKGDLAAKRAAVSELHDPEIVKKLFGPLAERFKERKGGYTRIYHLGSRLSDGSKMAIIKLVE